MLADALRCQKEGRDLDEASLVFSSRIGKEFLSVLKRSKVQQYKEMFPGQPVCAFCYMEHTVQAQQDLKYHRIARCATCSRFTVNLQS